MITDQHNTLFLFVLHHLEKGKDAALKVDLRHISKRGLTLHARKYSPSMTYQIFVLLAFFFFSKQGRCLTSPWKQIEEQSKVM